MATEPARGSARTVDGVSVFAVAWALAALWHLLGNTGSAPAWAQAVLVAGVGAVLLRPGAPLPFALLAVGGLLTMWEEAPFLSNHWLLAGFVDLAILAAVATGALRRRAGDRTDLGNRLVPVARLCLLGFYPFAAFAKLNSGFFDRSVSCAPFFYRESTESLGLHVLQVGGAAWVDHLVIYGTALVGLAIPALLFFRRTRNVGVVVALVFHGVLALDRSHEFFDFSSLLLTLFILFLPADAGSWVVERIGSLRARLALRHPQAPERVHLALVAPPVTVGVLVVVDGLTADRARAIGWWTWQLYSVVVIVLVVRFLRQHRSPATARLRPHHALFAALPLLVAANGLTPYLELKTGYGWNMYANLRTVDGESNHLIVWRTFPLTDEQKDVVRIISSSDDALAGYAATDYALTWRQLRIYLADHPDAAITYRRGGETVSLRRASDRPELVEPVPSWLEKVQLFRAVDLQEPERCAPTWGPAR